jgi:hypothetical protein
MKWFLIISAFIIVACSGFAGQKKNRQEKNAVGQKVSGSFSSFAVLELFTSEGCSSCPPADRLLPQLATENSNVIPLSFHVDYWNRLGWTDPFSHVEFSDRQREYGRQFRLESIYTPQLIINGEFEMVGSNRSVAQTDIKNALKEKATVEVTIDDVKKDGNTLLVSCALTGNVDQSDVMAALVQKRAEMKVSAGENRGAKLSHTNVVRSFLQGSAQQRMKLEIEIPQDLTEDNMQLIVYTQQKKDLKITGVAVWESNR